MSVIPPHVVVDLCWLGHLGESTSTEAKAILQRLAPCDEVNCQHWETWDKVSDRLATADLINLVRGLTLAEEALQWSGGSVSGVIWTYRALERRDRNEARPLAQWVIQHSQNHYVRPNVAPAIVATEGFDSMRGGARRCDEYQEHLASNAEARREAAEREAGGQAAAKARRAERARAKVRRQELKREDNIRRNARLVEMEGWPLDARFRAVAADTAHRPQWYPAAWARQAVEAIVDLSPDVRAQLALRLGDQRDGVWGRLARALRSV
jgi:hypothetical protein